MTARAFGSFAEASVFARELAGRLRRTVEIQREKESWLVECPSEEAVTPEPRPVPNAAVPKVVPPPSSPRAPTPRSVSPTLPATDKPDPTAVSKTDPSSRLCADCGCTISAARLQVSPNASRCVRCQSEYERGHDTRPKIDEGLAGTRAEHKRMRAQLWGDMRNRGRGK